MPKPKKLSDKKKKFAEEYMVDRNAYQAAKRAGYSDKYALAGSSALLKESEVAAYVEQLASVQSEQTHITANRVVTELAEIAFGDIRDHSSWNDQGLFLYDSAMLKTSRAIKSVKCQFGTDGVGRMEISMHDKNKALEGLAKYFKLYVERHEHDLSRNTIEALVLASFQDDSEQSN